MSETTERLDAINVQPVAFHKLNRSQLLTLAIALQDQRDNALTLARKQAAALERVEALHKHAHTDVEPWAKGYRYSGDHCAFDGEHWPCQTVTALEPKP